MLRKIITAQKLDVNPDGKNTQNLGKAVLKALTGSPRDNGGHIPLQQILKDKS